MRVLFYTASALAALLAENATATKLQTKLDKLDAFEPENLGGITQYFS
jgi:hypothetical protein